MNNRILEISKNNSNINFRHPTLGKELNLVDNFMDYKIDKFMKKKRIKEDIALAVLKEPEIDATYPDIIFVEYNKKNIYNWNENRKNLNNQDLKILYYLYSTKGLEAKEIVTKLGIRYVTLMQSIEKLLDSKLIKRENRLWQVADPENFFAVKNIETVEAKINQWESALRQAVRNSRFSSECYVLSELKLNPNKHTIEKFDDLGIGMYIKKDNSFKQISKAKRNIIPNSYTSLMIGEIIGNSINL